MGGRGSVMSGAFLLFGPLCLSNRWRFSYQGAQGVQIPLIERIHDDRARGLAFAFRRFEQHRQVAKPRDR